MGRRSTALTHRTSRFAYRPPIAPGLFLLAIGFLLASGDTPNSFAFAMGFALLPGALFYIVHSIYWTRKQTHLVRQPLPNIHRSKS